MTDDARPVQADARSVSTMRAAAAGASAALVAIGVSELLAGILPGATSFVAAIGQLVIDLQPPGAKDVVVALFGTNDKLALEIAVVLTAVAIGAGLGIVARRSMGIAIAGFALFGAVAFIATLGDPIANPTMVIVQVTAAVGSAIWTLQTLLGRAVTPAVPDPARRSFLLQATALGVAGLAAGLTGRWLIERSRSAPPPTGVGPGSGQIQPASDVVDPLAPGADLAPATPGLTPIVVPNDQFYRIDTALLVPTVDIAGWTLRIHGMVERETTLTFAELVGLPLFEQYVTIACVSNEVGGGLVGNAKWTGVRLREVLDIAGVSADATQLVGRSVDGFTAGMPTAWVMDPAREPMIAVAMNDEPLPPLHGYPARLIIPGLYGYVSATKWLSELELTRWETFDGYWVPLGWSKKALILTQSRIDTPRSDVAAGRVAIAGMAWAPDRGISRVEVGIDGAWRDADMSSPISDTTWVQWVVQWDAEPGEHTIRVRATDGDGVLQEELPSPPAPDGARGWHTRQIRVT